MAAAERDLGPVRAARLLRADLRRAREIAGLTQADVAARLGWSSSKFMRIESGAVDISHTDLMELTRVLGLGDAVAVELGRRNAVARSRGWWHEYRDDMSAALVTVAGLEAGADRLSMFVSEMMPRLLQTPAYAAAVLGDSPALTILRRRQEEVFLQDDMPEIRAVIDEAVLYRPIGGAEVMAAQVRWLAELDRRPAVEIRVLPFESTVPRWHGFAMIEDDRRNGTLVHIGLAHSDLLVDDEQVADFRRQFTELRHSALDRARTTQLLHRVAAGYDAGGPVRPWLWD
jgi:transcriptional regulator with XRE-family HTH domain